MQKSKGGCAAAMRFFAKFIGILVYIKDVQVTVFVRLAGAVCQNN